MYDSFHTGQNYNHTESFRAEQRAKLEADVQNLLGPIEGIADLSDAELYGMRDELKAEQRALAEEIRRVLNGEVSQ